MKLAERDVVYVARSRRGAPLSTAVRRALFFRPLAFALAFMLLRIPVLPPIGLVQPAFAGVDPCSPSADRILQDICPDGAPSLPLIQFEQEVVDDWLTQHRMPLSNAALIYQHGRSDLRSAIRAAMFVRIQTIIDKSQMQRTNLEQFVFLWFRQQVTDKEVGLFQHAVDERDRWESDACRWTPDPQIAEAYGLSYNGGGLACSGGLGALLKSRAQVPAKSYFLAAGLKESYGSKIAASPGGPEVLALTVLSIGSAIMGGLAVGIPTVTTLGLVVMAGIGPAGVLTHAGLGAGAASVVWGATMLAIAGSIVIVILAIVIGIVAAFQLAEEQKTLDELAELDTLLANAQSRFVSLPTLATTAEGVGKLEMTLIAATLPEFSSTSSIPSPGGDDPLFLLAPPGAPPDRATVSNNITYRDWEGNVWTASRPHLGFFNQAALVVDHFETSFSPTLRIVDPQTGEKRWVDLVGSNFLVVRANPHDPPKPCKADPLTGLTPLSVDLTTCDSWVRESIDLLDGNGTPQTVRMAMLPSFTSLPTTTFSNGVPKTFEVTATGLPPPSIVPVGSLPAGIDFLSVPDTGKLRLVYDATTPLGANVYSVQFRATNARGVATQNFTLRTGTDVAITSSGSPRFVAGKLGSFLVTTSGNPTPTISLSSICFGPLFGLGLSLTDNGDGTATLSGTPSTPLSAPQVCSPGFTATNGVQTDSQAIFVYVDPAPPAKLVSQNSTTFFSGALFQGPLNTFEFVTQGAETPVTISLRCSPPSWVSLNDHGDGTATLFGTPPVGTDGAFSFLVDVRTAGDCCHTIDCSTPNFTIHVSNLPTFLTPNQVTFGPPPITGGVLLVNTNQASGLISLEGQLPEGLSFDPIPDHGRATIQGIPAVGTGGIYPLVLSMTNAVGTGFHHLRLIVKEAPTFAGAPDSTVFFVGREKRVAVQTTGFPKLPELIGNQNPVEQAMHITLGGALPPGILFTDTDPFDVPTGTGLFSGIPEAGSEGVYPLTLTADNGVLPVATLDFTLRVVKPCPATADPDCVAGFAKGVFLVNEEVAGKEKLVAGMLKGPALTQTDLGNPLDAGQGGTDTAYSLCVYDGNGNSVVDVLVDRAGDVCAGEACWKAVGKAPNDPKGPGKGYKYKDPATASDGVFKLLYKGGDAGKSKVTLTGKGSGFPSGIPAALQSSSQVMMQLHTSDGICLSVDLSDIKEHEPSVFKAR